MLSTSTTKDSAETEQPAGGENLPPSLGLAKGIKLETTALLPRLLLSAVSGALFALPFISPTWFALSWIAFVPLLLAIENAPLRISYFCGFTMGIVAYMLSMHWVVEFLILFKQYSAGKSYSLSLVFWFYSAQLPALLALSYVALRRRLKVSAVFIFPPLLVAFYSLFPLYSSQVGESQSHFLWALQGIEFTGVYGLDFLIALINVTLVLYLQKRLGRRECFGVALVAVLWFGYGAYALARWDAVIATWPVKTVGLVQPNEIPSVARPKPYPGYSRTFPPEMEMTERLVAAGASLVVWPESHYKAYLEQTEVREAFDAQVAALATPLLFQDMEKVDPSGQDNRYYNTAFFIGGDGELAGRYRKIKRMAFGEKLPLVDDLPWLESIVKSYFGDFFREIKPGPGHEVFKTDDLSIVPLICYETMFPWFTASAVANDGSAALIVAMSSDGWFGRSKQPYQHFYSSALRAVENRVPMLHVINNGPSGLILPNGRVALETAFDEAGGYLVDVPYSKQNGGSFFSDRPFVFVGAVYLTLAAFVVAALAKRVRRF